MANVVIVGAQWGDEGKGKVVDLLAHRFDVVARYQGGPNAGHTVTIGATRHALHHVPSGAFRAGTRLIVGNGMVLDLAGLLGEIEGLEAAGIALGGRLFVSDRAHVILPIMAKLDAAAETNADDRSRIGTTRRGIGPAYEAKTGRTGLRVADLTDAAQVEERVRAFVTGPSGRELARLGGELGEIAAQRDEILRLGAKLAPFVADTTALLEEWLEEGSRVLFEGAQGTLLDVDHGSYPYVTSSNTIAGGASTGLGVAPTRIQAILGVFKAYATRVGSGPLPTELNDGPGGSGERIRKRGREYGTTTGRPRRCGWFDGVAAAHARRINRFDAACITLLDVLDEFDEIQVCTAYTLDGRELRRIPAGARDAERVRPVYESFPGWKSDSTAARRYEDLPAAARSYLERLEQIIGCEITLVSVGPERSQSIVRPGTWLARELDL